MLQIHEIIWCPSIKAIHMGSTENIAAEICVLDSREAFGCSSTIKESSITERQA
jgi:hypothetical protein